MCLLQGPSWPIPVNTAYVFGRALGDYESDERDTGLLEFAANLYKYGQVESISVPGYNPQTRDGYTDYPGGTTWRELLERMMVPRHRIFLTSGEKRPQHTRSDGDEFIETARGRGWTQAIIITNPHQMLRAMLGLIISMREQGYQLKLYACVLPRVDWHKPVYGSQGQKRLPRHEHIREEWERISKYQATGDIASLEELRSYLLSL